MASVRSGVSAAEAEAAAEAATVGAGAGGGAAEEGPSATGGCNTAAAAEATAVEAVEALW